MSEIEKENAKLTIANNSLIKFPKFLSKNNITIIAESKKIGNTYHTKLKDKSQFTNEILILDKNLNSLGPNEIETYIPAEWMQKTSYNYENNRFVVSPARYTIPKSSASTYKNGYFSFAITNYRNGNFYDKQQGYEKIIELPLSSINYTIILNDYN